MTIALIGPSGAGKGTQAIKLAAEYDLLHISTGDLFRESLDKRTALGLLAKRYMNQGDLVPDEVVDAMVEEWMWKVLPSKRILFDGFPRTKYQATSLDKLFRETDRYLEAIIYLKVPDEEIVRRLPGRVICRTCQAPYHLEFKPPAIDNICDICHGDLYERADDRPDIIRARLKASHRTMGALVNHYQETGKLVIIDGAGTIEEVHRAVVDVVEALNRREARSATREETEQIQALKGNVAALSFEESTHSLDIVLLGGPGSGKGTQAEQLKQKLNLKHVATGDLFRENIKNETDLGKLAKTYMNRGELVPDDVTEAMVKDRLARPDFKDGFILDGFPRTISQAEALNVILTDLQRRLDGVFHIKVSDDEIVRRLSGRLICRDCQTPYHKEFNPPTKEDVCDACGGELYQRDDDNPDTIRARLKTYHAQTAPLIGYYQETGLLIEIDGEGDMSEVKRRVLAGAQALSEKRAKQYTKSTYAASKKTALPEVVNYAILP